MIVAYMQKNEFCGGFGYLGKKNGGKFGLKWPKNGLKWPKIA